MRDIYLFRTVRDVIKAEKILLTARLTPKVLPVPTRLSSECGMCLEIPAARTGEATRLLTEARITLTHEQL